MELNFRPNLEALEVRAVPSACNWAHHSCTPDAPKVCVAVTANFDIDLNLKVSSGNCANAFAARSDITADLDVSAKV